MFNISNINSELKRRNIYKVMTGYLGGGWVLAQVATYLEGLWNLPAWVDTVAVAILIIGFPIAFFLAWTAEITPEGIKLTESANDDSELKGIRKLGFSVVICIALVAAVIAFTIVLPSSLEEPSKSIASENTSVSNHFSGLEQTFINAKALSDQHKHNEAIALIETTEKELSGADLGWARYMRAQHILWQSEHSEDSFFMFPHRVEVSIFSENRADKIIESINWGDGPEWEELLGIRDIRLADKVRKDVRDNIGKSNKGEIEALLENGLKYYRSARKHLENAGKLSPYKEVLILVGEVEYLSKLERITEAGPLMSKLRLLLKTLILQKPEEVNNIFDIGVISSLTYSASNSALEVAKFSKRNFLTIRDGASTPRARVLAEYYLLRLSLSGSSPARPSDDYVPGINKLIEDSKRFGLEGFTARLHWDKVLYIEKYMRLIKRGSSLAFIDFVEMGIESLVELSAGTVSPEESVNINALLASFKLCSLVLTTANPDSSTGIVRGYDFSSMDSTQSVESHRALRVIYWHFSQSLNNATPKQRLWVASSISDLFEKAIDFWNPGTIDYMNHPSDKFGYWSALPKLGIIAYDSSEIVKNLLIRQSLLNTVSMLTKDVTSINYSITELERLVTQINGFELKPYTSISSPANYSISSIESKLLGDYMLLNILLANTTNKKMDKERASALQHHYKNLISSNIDATLQHRRTNAATKVVY
jgi:hypothetical protein